MIEIIMDRIMVKIMVDWPMGIRDAPGAIWGIVYYKGGDN